jgi:hypothetical protein
MRQRWGPPMLTRNTLWYLILVGVPVLIATIAAALLPLLRGCA